MSSRNDSLGLGDRTRHPAWGYALRKWWAIVLGVAAGAAVMPLIMTESAPAFESEAVVSAVRTRIPVEDFELAPTLFATDRVVSPVIEDLGLEESRSSLLASGQLESEAVSGGGLKVIARQDDPDVAVDLANGAAESFAAALESEGLGEFSVLSAQDANETSGPSPVVVGLAGAVAGGALAGLLLLFLYVVRRPVLAVEDALADIPADVALSARIRMRRRNLVVTPAGFFKAIKREVHSGTTSKQGRSDIVLLLVTRRRRRLNETMTSFLNLTATFRGADGGAAPRSSVPGWIDSRSDRLAEALDAADTVMCVVQSGAMAREVHRLGEELVVSAPSAKKILIFVRSSRSRRLLGRSKKKIDEAPPHAERLRQPDSAKRPAKSI